MSPKEYYLKCYKPDDLWRTINDIQMHYILSYQPKSVFEFGCGTGKNLAYFKGSGIYTEGIELNEQTVNIARDKNLRVSIGDEHDLKHFKNFDIVFTCSVLCHIENIAGIVDDLKRIANKSVILLETNEIRGKFYYPHNYEQLGFEKASSPIISLREELGNGATYYLYRWDRVTQI